MHQRVIKTLSPEQQIRLIEYLQGQQTLHPQDRALSRNACIILLMLDAGLRIGENCHLQKGDLWFGEGPVIDLTVRLGIAKNGIERTVPLSNRLREAIKNLHDFIWTSSLNPPETDGPSNGSAFGGITPRQVQRIVAAITTAALGMAFNPHALRHTFATKMMHLTDIRTVQMLLGHASLSSTQIYTHPTLTDLREAINKTNGIKPSP